MWKLLTRSGDSNRKDASPHPPTAAPLQEPRSLALGASAPPVVPAAPDHAHEDRAIHARNRREHTRYTAVQEGLWLGWWTDDEFIVVNAQLVNISEGGVLTQMETAPTQGQIVWMRLEGTSTKQSLAAKVLESRWVTLRRRWVVRLEFQQACPQDFYESAVYGS